MHWWSAHKRKEETPALPAEALPCCFTNKKTNNNKLQQRNWIIVRRVGFSTFSSGPGTDLFFSSPVHGIHLTIPVIDHVIEIVMAAKGKL